MEELDSKKTYKLKKFIKFLEPIKGRHTELVSVYIPSGYDINKIIQQLEQEQGTASNIQDAKTRKHVIDSLEKLVRHLRLYKKTPINGLAAFAGDASKSENKVDIKVWSIEPPIPLNTRLYRCDQTFVLDLLKSQLEHHESYGLIVLDKREANIGLLRGNSVIQLSKLTSGVPGKYKTGGQCNHPDTLVEINKSLTKIKNIKKGDLLKSYDFENKKFIFSKCIDKWKVKKNEIVKILTKDNKIIISSKDHLFFTKPNKEKPAENLTTKDFLLTVKDSKILPVQIHKIEIENKPTQMVDISVKDNNFIANGIIVHNSAARFARLREEAAQVFYRRIAEDAKKEFFGKKEIKGILIGGPGPTKQEFYEGDYLTAEIKNKVLGLKDLTYTDEFGLNELVEKSQDLLAETSIIKEKEILNKFFTKLAKEPEKVTYGLKETKNALEMGAVEILIVSESLDNIEELEEFAESTGAKTEVVSIETQEGIQLKNLGGIGAILRFPIY